MKRKRGAHFQSSNLSCFVSVFFFLLCYRDQKLWEDSQVENERLRDRLRGTNEELSKCKDQLENAFQVVSV